MNILILTTHMNKGGISRYVINLAAGLSGRHHKVWVATSGGEWLGELNKLNIPHRYIPINTKAILSPKVWLSLLLLIPLIKKEKIQIIHGNTRVTQALSFLLGKFCCIPYVSTFHGFYSLGILRKLFKLAGVRSIAVSNAVKKYISENFLVNSDNIDVVYNGLNISDFTAQKAIDNSLGFKNSDFLIGILGRVSEEKGHLLAVEAFWQISKKYPNTYLLISGKGKLEDKVKLFIERFGLTQRVRFINKDAQQFLDLIDLLIMPSRQEGFGYSIIEAMVKKVPVVGFNIGGISEIIQDNINGIIFYDYNANSLSDAIDKVINNRQLRENIVARASYDVNRFSLEKMAQATEAVYQKVLK